MTAGLLSEVTHNFCNSISAASRTRLFDADSFLEFDFQL